MISSRRLQSIGFKLINESTPSYTLQVPEDLLVSSAVASISLTLPLPANCRDGDSFTVMSDGAWGVNTLTLVPGTGMTLSGAAANLIYFRSISSLQLVRKALNWVVTPIYKTTASQGSDTVLNLSDIPSNGSIGTAASTIDLYSTVVFTQTTIAVTASLPDPTNPLDPKLVTVYNSGTTALTVGSAFTAVIDVAKSVVFAWFSSAWRPLNTLTIRDTIQTVTATGTLTAYQSLYLVNSTTATTQTLPNATLDKVGQRITVKNMGTGVVTLAAFAANTVSTLPTLSMGSSLTLEVSATSTLQIVGYYSNALSSPDTLTPWTAANDVLQYTERSLVIGGSDISMTAVAPMTTAALFTLAEAGNWTYTGQNSVNTFPASTIVLRGFQIVDSGQTYHANSRRTTGLVFDPTEIANWTALSSSATGSRINLSNFTANGAIGTALATVDVADIITFAQTNVNITVTVPTPTTIGTHKTITLENLSSSTASLTIHLATGSITLSSGQSSQIQWNGTAWSSMRPFAVTLPQWVANRMVPYGAVVSMPMGSVVVTMMNMSLRLTNPTFDAAEAALWMLVGQAGVSSFPSTSTVLSGLIITNGGQLYQALTSRVTVAAFSTAEKTNWTQVTTGSATTVFLPNFTASAVAGTAVDVVDTAGILAFTQTTSGVSITLPTPTVIATHKQMTMENMSASTATLTFALGVTFSLAPGSSQIVEWNGTTWSPMGTVNVAAEYGEITTLSGSTTSGGFVDIPSSTFTLPTAGVWEVILNITHGNVSNASSAYRLMDVTGGNVAVVGSTLGSSDVAGNFAINDSIVLRLTTSAANSYKAQFNTSVGTVVITAGSSRISWKKISGNLPVTGTTVDFVTAYLGANQLQAQLGPLDHLKFDTVMGGNIQLDTSTAYATTNGVASVGRFQLTAGKIYKLEASVGQAGFSNNAQDTEYGWYNADTGALIGVSAIIAPGANGSNSTPR